MTPVKQNLGWDQFLFLKKKGKHEEFIYWPFESKITKNKLYGLRSLKRNCEFWAESMLELEESKSGSPSFYTMYSKISLERITLIMERWQRQVSSIMSWLLVANCQLSPIYPSASFLLWSSTRRKFKHSHMTFLWDEAHIWDVHTKLKMGEMV